MGMAGNGNERVTLTSSKRRAMFPVEPEAFAVAAVRDLIFIHIFVSEVWLGVANEPLGAATFQSLTDSAREAPSFAPYYVTQNRWMLISERHGKVCVLEASIFRKAAAAALYERRGECHALR
jgi:hypothetical protein